MNLKRTSLLLFCLLAFIIAYSISGCASLKTFLNGSTTNLKSNSLVAASAMRAKGITIAGSLEGSNWLITPSKISGKVMSVVLPISGEADDGITPFGNGRPDIAPAQSKLYDFDLSNVTALKNDVINFKDTFVGGKCDQIILLFGYFDVEFVQGTKQKKIRMVYGDTGSYVRGDKLLLNANGTSTGSFYWYDTSSGAFAVETGTRPTSPSINSFVKNFSDPIRPNLHYYMLGAKLRNNTDYDGTRQNYITLSRTICEDNDLTFTVDFDVLNAVVFTNVASSASFEALTDAELIQKFDMKQNVSDWSDTALFCSITFEATKRIK